LSSQLQNFNFCNFFFKISVIKSFSGFSPETIPFHTHTAERTVYRFLQCRQLPFLKKSQKNSFLLTVPPC
jgi:hypothetical protein